MPVVGRSNAVRAGGRAEAGFYPRAKTSSRWRTGLAPVSAPPPRQGRWQTVGWVAAAVVVAALIAGAIALQEPLQQALDRTAAGWTDWPLQRPGPAAHNTSVVRKGDRLADAAMPTGDLWHDLLRPMPGEGWAGPQAFVVPRSADGRRVPSLPEPRVAVLPPGGGDSQSGQGRTHLIGFRSSAFPYSGVNPRTQSGGYSGGRYGDNRVLVHVPPGFDIRTPGVIVLFFHGHGATLSRDVRDRQQLPRQITESGVNAVLVAPQLAFDAADSSAGKFWERGGLRRFLDEAAGHLAHLVGDAGAETAFARMPVVVVAYSGGFVAAAFSLNVGEVAERVRGVVLLDALYGETEKFSSWITDRRYASFFVSAYTPHTAPRDEAFVRALADKGIPVVRTLNGPLRPGTIAFLATGDISHRDFVTRAWTADPVRDVLVRMTPR